MPNEPRRTAPADYAQLFEEYIGFVRALVIAGGVRPADADDAASEILIKFIEKDALTWYDPEKVHHKAVDGTVVDKTASFKTLLRRFVSLYNRQVRDRQYNRDRRESVRLDAEITAPDLVVALGRRHAPDPADEVTTVESARVLLREIRYNLAKIPWGLETFAIVFDAAVEAYTETNILSATTLAEALDVPLPTAKRVLSLLRHHLSDLYPGPVLGYLA